MATLYESPLKRSHFDTELEDFDPSPKRVAGVYSEAEAESISFFPASWAQAFATSSLEHVTPREGKKRNSSFEDYSRAKRILTADLRQSLEDQENEINPYIFNSNMKRLHQSFEEEVQSVFEPHKRQRPEFFQPSQETTNLWTTDNPTPRTPPNSPNRYAIVPVQPKLPFKTFQISEDYQAYLPRPLHAELPQEYLQLTVWEPPSLENGRLFELPMEEPVDSMDWS